MAGVLNLPNDHAYGDVLPYLAPEECFGLKANELALRSQKLPLANEGTG